MNNRENALYNRGCLEKFPNEAGHGLALLNGLGNPVAWIRFEVQR